MRGPVGLGRGVGGREGANGYVKKIAHSRERRLGEGEENMNKCRI